MQGVKKQVPNSDKNTEIKYPKGDKIFIGCDKGIAQEFSIVEKKTIHDHGRLFYSIITSIAITHDNKSWFMCDGYGNFKELDISKRKQINSFPLNSATYCVITSDNKSLITVEYGNEDLSLK